MKWIMTSLSALCAFLLATSAQAAGEFDEVVTSIGAAGADMKSVGAAMIGLVVIVVLFAMVRRMMR